MYRSLNPGMIGVDLPFEKLAKLAPKYGYGAVELSPAALVEEYGVAGTQDIMGQNGLILSSFMLPVSFQWDPSKFEETFPKLEVAAKAAEKLGCHRCSTYILNFSDALPYKENFENHRRMLTECAKVLADHDIRFGLEFVGPKTLAEGHKYPFIRGLKEMLELCDAIGTGNMGILYDAYHWYTAGLDFSAFDLFRKEEEVVSVHINDAKKGLPIDECLDGLRYLPGEGGGVDLKGFLQHLKDMHYTGPVIVEPFSETLKAMNTPEEKLAAVQKAVDSIWVD
jgi:sugar phosphate isomerase/epimerase